MKCVAQADQYHFLIQFDTT